jgi:hypothetical protein
MHSMQRRAAPYLLTGEQDPGFEGLGAGMFYGRHDTICLPEAEASTLDQGPRRRVLQEVNRALYTPAPRISGGPAAGPDRG